MLTSGGSTYTHCPRIISYSLARWQCVQVHISAVNLGLFRLLLGLVSVHTVRCKWEAPTMFWLARIASAVNLGLFRLLLGLVSVHTVRCKWEAPAMFWLARIASAVNLGLFRLRLGLVSVHTVRCKYVLLTCSNCKFGERFGRWCVLVSSHTVRCKCGAYTCYVRSACVLCAFWTI